MSDQPTSREEAQTELDQHLRLLGQVSAIQQRAAFLTGWINAYDAFQTGGLPLPVVSADDLPAEVVAELD